jgi:hypothetical protein
VRFQLPVLIFSENNAVRRTHPSLANRLIILAKDYSAILTASWRSYLGGSTLALVYPFGVSSASSPWVAWLLSCCACSGELSLALMVGI